MQIFKDGTRQITTNFTEQEFYSKSPGAPNWHYVSAKAIAGAQIIRDFVGEPVTVSSSFRPQAYNQSIGSQDTSMHLNYFLDTNTRLFDEGNGALDLSMSETALKKVFADLDEKGTLYDQLRNAGITSFGMYDSFVHIDDGGGYGVKVKHHYFDSLGEAAMWDLRVLLRPEKKTSDKPYGMHSPKQMLTVTEISTRALQYLKQLRWFWRLSWQSCSSIGYQRSFSDE